LRTTSDNSSSDPFNATIAGRKESGTEPIAPLAWAMVLVIAIFSCYVYVLSEQVNRAETLRHVWLQKTATPVKVEQFSATPADQYALGTQVRKPRRGMT
jgi:hypothetical protein